MLQALRATLILDEPFEACIWAMVTCAFWGMMCFSEVSVSSRSTFNPTKHLKCEDVHFDYDLDRKLYVCLNLPSAKTAKPGEIQSVYMVPQEELCPLKALQNLAVMFHINLTSEPLIMCQSSLRYAVCHHLFHQ
jgi:hypothetical protein